MKLTPKAATISAALLTAVARQPYSTGELVPLLGVHNGIIARICKHLARRALIVRLPDHRWAEAGQGHAAAAPVVPVKSVNTPLRQVLSRSSMKRDAPPSWWVGLDRTALGQQAEARVPAMHHSKEALLVRGITIG